MITNIFLAELKVVVVQEAYWHMCLPPCCLVKLLSGFIQATAEDYKIENGRNTEGSFLICQFEREKFTASMAIARLNSGSATDLDIGKDFLSSWKSISVAEDMDFDFGSVTKGNKKTFSFDKMDMDFNLDGDFDKISSFKVDMSDLDISSDTKKLENPRKKSKEVPAGESHQGKTDCFAFPFDFNELDNISFESTLMKEDRKSKKAQDREESLNRSESEGSGLQLIDDVGASKEGITRNLSASGTLITSKNDIQLDSMNEDATVENESCTSKSAKTIEQIAIRGTRTSLEKTISTSPQETKQESSRPLKTTSPEPYAQETMLDLSVKSLSRNASTQDTGSDLQEVSTVPAEMTTSPGGGQNVRVKSIAGLGTNYENVQLENLPPEQMASSQNINSERNKSARDNHALTCDKDATEPAQGDLRYERASVTTISRQLLHHTQPNSENQDSNAKLLSAPVNWLDNLPRSSLYLNKQLCKACTESWQLDNVEQQTHDANDAQSGNKLAGISSSHPRELTRSEPIETGSQESVKSLSSTWSGIYTMNAHSIHEVLLEGVNTDGTESGGELFATSRVHDHDAKKGEIVLEGSEKNIKALTTFSSHINPSNLSERTNKSTSQGVNPRLSVSSMKSLQSTKKICVERNKISAPNSGTRTPDLSTLRISRDRGSNTDPLKSRFQRDINSLGDSGQNMELQENGESKMAHSADIQRHISPTPTLKRKTFEKSNADLLTLNPAKRLSESPKDNRVIDKQVFYHENVADDNTRNVISDYEIPTLGIPRDVNTAELETPLAMESESNVEKAEACTKELEDLMICYVTFFSVQLLVLFAAILWSTGAVCAPISLSSKLSCINLIGVKRCNVSINVLDLCYSATTNFCLFSCDKATGVHEI
ncbi:hypothetical protein LguiB_004911 [Lonicera macranthoides]